MEHSGSDRPKEEEYFKNIRLRNVSIAIGQSGVEHTDE
jgi:hypothetical protein